MVLMKDDDFMKIRKTDYFDTLFKPLSAEKIYSELEESRACYERGEYEDFDDALDEISKKYDL